MTGPATYASPVLTKERPILNLPRDVAGLRAECKRRKIETSGSMQDVSWEFTKLNSAYNTANRHIQLINRVQADELSHNRAFSTAATDSSKRPTPNQHSSTQQSPTVRHFNTSRSLKAVGDSSTIDFAYLPTDALTEPTPEVFRVPILPDTYVPRDPAAADEDVVVMKPEISTMSADAVYLPMSELSDGHAMNIDFHAMADRVAVNLRKIGGDGKLGPEEQASLIKQVWGDLVDDVVKAVGGRKGVS
jgi:hypothetical protein